ncbi:uroporphyrinogen-III synthase [Ureibacillus chungkukjangi]|uniref:Uroporphyrinogen-III synthase n=1 Tax=Ureibacillus chungkukjangi TaxID=1202712 RepID=A0A318TR15_9BACL|nr:uroporphyrinogen-III synthase [Ureibacillus chungkukjangi]MCM3390061.1 uroporphyrinogen-III synthase [Ureibacillus chungkukjangi]PYF07272.1 uroporphyrinogen-III synthase [Ureibacillus chungkukjangi]
MSGLNHKCIALLGTRKIDEQINIIRQLGGSAVHRPAQGTVFFDSSFIGSEVKEIINGHFEWAIFTTGIGFEKLFEVAAEMGLEAALQAALEKMNIAIRGYKSANALKKRGLVPIVRDDDGSISGLLREMHDHDLKDKTVAVQLYGDPAVELINWLKGQQADFKEIIPYEHIPPQKEVLDQIMNEILTSKVDAVGFTSIQQVRFLFNYAVENNQDGELLHAFENHVLALPVGKVTGKALQERGVTRMIIPEDERIGSALMTLNKYYKETVTK